MVQIEGACQMYRFILFFSCFAVIFLVGCDGFENPVTDAEGVVIKVVHNTFNGGRIQVEVFESYDGREGQACKPFSLTYQDSKRISVRGLAYYLIHFTIPRYPNGPDVWKLDAYVEVETAMLDPYDIIIESPPLDIGSGGGMVWWEETRIQ